MPTSYPQISVSESGRFSPYTDDNQLAPLFAQELEKSEQSQLFHLIALQVPDRLAIESGVLSSRTDEKSRIWFYLADSNYPLTFDGVTYSRFPLKFTGASISSDGTIDKASIVVANINRWLMDYVELYDGLRNMRVKVKTVYARFLDYLYTPNADGTVTAADNPGRNNQAYIEDEYYIDNYSANEQVITFQLDPIIDLEIRIPRRRYMQDSCYFIYMDAGTCGYVNHVNDAGVTVTSPTCKKTLDDCIAHKNEANFGGFPGISANRRIILG